MRGDLLVRHAHLPADPAPSPSSLARRAVELAGAGLVAVTTALATFGIAYAIGGEEATSDNWVGVLVVALMLGGLLVSLAGFVAAVVARAGHERWWPLWLPLAVFPALVAFVVLGEVFWWE